MKPEEKARIWIDQKLEEAGWHVVDRKEYTPDMYAVAVRETLLQGNKEADYMLLLSGRAVAVLEAKRREVPLVDDPRLIRQVLGYGKGLPDWFPCWESPLQLVFISNGHDIACLDAHQENAEFVHIPSFPNPKKLLSLVGAADSFAGLPYLNPAHLRKCQFEAITALEKSFQEGKKRALICLATGAGKTYAACMETYRLLSFTNHIKRVLFLVDRNNLGRAAAAEFAKFVATQNGALFTDIYGVEQLTNKNVDARARVVISTIQRLYSQLSGSEEDFDEEQEDSAGHMAKGMEIALPEKTCLPPDFFDLIIIDECHRSIYSEWRRVLDYFSNAMLIGMTATPIPETLAFFDNNMVANYTLEQSIADGVNVPHRIYRIKTELGENGGDINAGDALKVLVKADGSMRDKTAAEHSEFSRVELNRSIVVKDQIRKVLQEYKESVYTKMFPEREPDFRYLPKTLIFAVSEAHARNIVEIVKEVFERDDDRFVQQITYSAGDSNKLIKSFRNDKDFRVAVTVTLVATGTDVRPLEVLIFLNDVRSETLYTQMKGRGVRTIDPSELQSATPNAISKEVFFLIDAVGVTESEKIIPAIGEADAGDTLNPTLEFLLERLSQRFMPDDYLYLLAGKLGSIGRNGDTEELAVFAALAGFTPPQMASSILATLEAHSLPPFISPNEPNTERLNLVAPLLTNIAARKKLVEIARGYVKEIIGKPDTLIEAGFSREEARASTAAFERYVNTHRDELKALRFIYNHEANAVSYEMLQELVSHLQAELSGFSVARLWGDYAILDRSKVRLLADDRDALTNLIQLARKAYRQIDTLVSLPALASQRFELWCGQKQRELPMSAELKEVFRKISLYVATNGMYTFQSLHVFEEELTNALLRHLGTVQAAQAPLTSLNDFMLKAA